MIDCKNCLHDGVCYMQEVCNDIEQQLKDFGCDNFKDKADVVEVRHGYWISGWDTVCSVCKIDVDVYDVERFNYCPNCGAKMDGKEVEGNG